MKFIKFIFASDTGAAMAFIAALRAVAVSGIFSVSERISSERALCRYLKTESMVFTFAISDVYETYSFPDFESL